MPAFILGPFVLLVFWIIYSLLTLSLFLFFFLKTFQENMNNCYVAELHTFHRSGSTNGTYKLDSSSSPASCLARATSKHEHEKASLTKDLAAGLNKEKLLAKGNNKYVFTI